MSHRPRKRFGQNFLHDTLVIDRIVQHINPQPDDAMVEVGPGLGALTLPLLAHVQSLHVVEIDRDLIAKLAARQLPGLAIHAGDALTLDFTALTDGRPLRIVGNLPFNIGTPLLIRLLEFHAHIKDIHVMLQKEVVDRLHATTGTRNYGRLSVLIQSMFTVEPLMQVPADAFQPPPKVQSTVVRLRPRADAPGPQAVAALSAATRLAFANKRKTIRNNLKQHISSESLIELGIDPGVRAETLNLEQFARLAAVISLPEQRRAGPK